MCQCLNSAITNNKGTTLFVGHHVQFKPTSSAYLGAATPTGYGLYPILGIKGIVQCSAVHNHTNDNQYDPTMFVKAYNETLHVT